MAEIEPASDELIAAAEAEANAVITEFVKGKPLEIWAGPLLAILARLRKAEADNANMAKMLQGYHQICSEAGIAPSSSEIYAAAERAQGGGDE